MNCLDCGHELPEGAAFCPTCGAPVAHCPVCDSLVPSDAAFCGSCGADLRHLERTGEFSLFHDRDGQSNPSIPLALDSVFAQKVRGDLVGFLYNPLSPLEHHPLRPGDNTIGSGLHNDVVIDEETVSWTHALVLCKRTRVLIQDSASTNGTFLNGVEVVRPVGARHGDLLRFADVDFALWLRQDLRS